MTDDPPLVVITQMPSAVPAAGTTAAPSPTSVPFLASHDGGRTWSVPLMLGNPATVTLRALSATGSVLAEREATLEWRRVGGTEQCGGPHEAGPIRLEIPV